MKKILPRLATKNYTDKWHRVAMKELCKYAFKQTEYNSEFASDNLYLKRKLAQLETTMIAMENKLKGISEGISE